jgi:hypothetical protein
MTGVSSLSKNAATGTLAAKRLPDFSIVRYLIEVDTAIRRTGVLLSRAGSFRKKIFRPKNEKS